MPSPTTRRRFVILPFLGLFCPLIQARAAVTLTGDTSRPILSTFAVGEPVTLEFHATGLAAGNAGIKLLLDIDDEHDAVLRHQELAVSPDGAGNWSVTVPAPADRLGFYRVYAKLSNGVPLASLGTRHGNYLTYCIVPDPTLRQVYPQDRTRFGMQGGFSVPMNPLLPYLGIRWVLGEGRWESFEPDHPGEFAEKIAAAKAAGREVLTRPEAGEGATYGGKHWDVYTLPTLYYSAPKWARDPTAPHANNDPLRPAVEGAWTEYAGARAREERAAYPGYPKRLYQITWEPDFPWGFSGTQEQLVRIYELSYGAIHAADPDALVVGPTYAGFEPELTRTVFEKGLGRYIDGFSIHPYFGSAPEQHGMVDLLRQQADLIHQSTGKDLPRVGTEEGYSTGDDKAKELDMARTLTRQNLILLGEGYWFNMAFYIADYFGEPGYGYYYNLNPKIEFGTDKVSPKPAAPVFAAQSFLLDGSRSAGPIEWLSPTTLGYAFERGGEVTLALWDYGDSPRQVSIPVGVPRVTVYDWMGNAHLTDSPGGSLALTLGPEPVYVVGAATRLWGSSAQKPLHLGTRRLTSFPGIPTHVIATVQPGASGLHGTLTLTPDPRLGLPTVTKPVAVAAGGKQQVDFFIPVPASLETGGYTLTLALRDPTRIVAGDGVRLDVQPPASITAVTPALRMNEAGLSVTLNEAQNAPLSGRIFTRIEGVPGSTGETPFTLTPHGSRTFTLTSPDLVIAPSRTYTAKVRVETAASYSFEQDFPVDFLSAGRLQVPPVVDGKLDEWQTLPAVTLAGREAVVRSPQYYTGALVAKVYYAWDDRALYLAADVTDPKFVQDNTGAATWKGDSLQLGFDMDTGKAAALTGNRLLDAASQHRSQEINLALTKNGPEAYRAASYDGAMMPVGPLSPADLKLAVVQGASKLDYEAAIPWKTLGRDTAPKVGDRLGVALTVNDMNDSKQLDPAALGLFGGIAESKDINRYGVLLLGGTAAPAPAAPQPSLRFSGVMGQSQPSGGPPLTYIGVNGAAMDTAGTLWTVGGSELLGFTEVGGKRVCTRRVPFPVGAKLPLQSDGLRLFFTGQDDKLYGFDPKAAAVTPEAIGSVDPKAKAFTVAPAGLERGFAARGKWFVLAGNTVSALDEAGKAVGTVLMLPPPSDPGWYYGSLGMEPATGDLLVGSYYPDNKIYRYGPDGKEIREGGWPRGVFAQGIVNVKGMAWALISGGGGQSLPLTISPTAAAIEPDWTFYTSGLAAEPSGGYWVASSQGLTRFDPHGKALHERLGGMAGARTLALGSDGTLLAGIEDGQRFVRFALDDDPDASFTSNANEPWRVGAGWTNKASAVVPDGAAFLILDETTKQFWRFDPARTTLNQTPWTKVPGPAGLTAPRALAAGETLVWTLDGPRLLEGTRNDLASSHPVTLPDSGDIGGVTALAASTDSMIVLADTTHVKAYTRHPDGAYTLLWQAAAPFGDVTGLAVTSAGVLVSDAGAGMLSLLSSQTGAVLARLDKGSIPGGWKPGLIAANGSWAVLVDDGNARLVRIRVR